MTLITLIDWIFHYYRFSINYLFGGIEITGMAGRKVMRYY